MRAITRRFAAVAASTALAVAGVAACSSQDDTGRTASIVASTDVWGSVAAAVAGDQAKVDSLLKSAVADPHSYEASPADAAAITDASLVVYNGGGYDHWVDDVLAAHPGVTTVDAYSLLPAPSPGSPPANEHVFYDLGTAKAVANQIAERLAATDRARGEEYRDNAATFGRQADAILESERTIGRNHPGASVVATEPVAHYLLVNSGVADRTPAAFARAAEEGDDPSPADLAAVLDLITSRQVDALLVNPQTESSAAKQIQDAARGAGVPIVTVTETLPEGADYLTWQRDTAAQLAAQLGTGRTASR